MLLSEKSREAGPSQHLGTPMLRFCPTSFVEKLTERERLRISSGLAYKKTPTAEVTICMIPERTAQSPPTVTELDFFQRLLVNPGTERMRLAGQHQQNRNAILLLDCVTMDPMLLAYSSTIRKHHPSENRFTRFNRACGRRERSQAAAKGKVKHKTFSHLQFLTGALPRFAFGSSSFECSWTCTRSRSCTDGFTHL